MTEQMTGPTLGFFPLRMHADILSAMARNGVSLDDGDAVLLAYAASLSQFFRGLKSEGHPAERIDGWADWVAENIKHNVNPPADPVLPRSPGGR